MDALTAALAAALDGTLPRMAFHQYGQFYNDDPDFDIEAYYGRVAAAILADPAFREALRDAYRDAWQMAANEARPKRKNCECGMPMNVHGGGWTLLHHDGYMVDAIVASLLPEAER